MQTNLAFSRWFFFLVRKAQQVIAAWIGTEDPDPWFPYLRKQSYCAWIALFVATLYFNRPYMRGIVLSAWRDWRAPDGGVSYRTALVVLTFCLVATAEFLVVAGMSPVLGTIYVGLCLLLCGVRLAFGRSSGSRPTRSVGSARAT